MEEKELQQIGHIIKSAIDAKLGEAEERLTSNFDKKFEHVREEISGDNRQYRKEFRREINEDFKHHVGILTEDFQHKLQIVAEGHQMLSEKLDRVEDKLEKKIDAVAIDLAAHRADTEGHKRGYMVREP